jgi:transcriptional regulator with XRE-family HTH domain
MNNQHPPQTQAALLLPCVKESDSPAPTPPRLPDIEKKPAVKRSLSPEHQELVNMRLKLGLSQAQFAEELGIGVPRLSSYEYGRAGSIPEWVMTAARELATNSGEAQESNRKKYEGLEMPAILAGWAKALGVPYEDNGQLAALLGTSVSTLTRWKNKLTRPSLHSLAFHEHMVDQAKQKLAKQKACIEELAGGKAKRR